MRIVFIGYNEERRIWERRRNERRELINQRWWNGGSIKKVFVFLVYDRDGGERKFKGERVLRIWKGKVILKLLFYVYI